MLSTLMKEHLKVEISRMRKPNFLEFEKNYDAKMMKIIMRKHGLKNVSECPLCGSRDFLTELEIENTPLVKCRHCDLCFHTRIPADPADVYHDEEHLAYPMDEAFEEHYRYRVERFGRERVRLLQKYCGDLSDKKILDVGCGNGYCLMALKETGAQCFGSEFSKKWRSFAMEKTGVTVYEEPLEHFPQRDFDVLTLFDVIEHIEKPVPFMEAAGRLLKPGGRVLIYTPNFDSFSIRVMGKYSNHISPHGHLIFFNRKALDYLGHKTGFRIVHSETRGLDVHSILSYQEYQGEQRDPFLVRWGDEIQAMIDASGSGDYIRIIYEKTN